MNRLEQIFTELRTGDRKALMPFVTAGYPALPATAAMLPAIEAAGASVCELGIPFSDPIADGPVIQASMTRALEGGISLDAIFQTVASVRDRVNMGLVCMVSYSIVYRIGTKAFYKRAAEAGFDGMIIPDLALEEAESERSAAAEQGLTLSMLIAPTTPGDRARRIARACSGFVYMVARTGITGAQDRAPEGLAERVAAIRDVTDLPIAVGFGISAAEHVRAVVKHADAAIVGSALVKRIGEHLDETPEQIADAAGQFVRELATGLV